MVMMLGTNRETLARERVQIKNCTQVMATIEESTLSLMTNDANRSNSLFALFALFDIIPTIYLHLLSFASLFI